eukprot:TRINITY_DN8732_c0_g1_i12.p1 TRINITY_DN8732_c0_g1~~TRINITY_DN8732_c0_g1_i12.p1  ORF type:complete len:160 (-),score=4.83 TRINITY_DN8732_c0_g1_i12:59-538(-)
MCIRDSFILGPNICIILAIFVHHKRQAILLAIPYLIKNVCLIESYIVLCNQMAVKAKSKCHTTIAMMGILFNGITTLIFGVIIFGMRPVNKEGEGVLIALILLCIESAIGTFTSILSYITVKEITARSKTYLLLTGGFSSKVFVDEFNERCFTAIQFVS